MIGHSHNCFTGRWEECQEVVGLAGVSPDFTFHQQQNRILPEVQALAPVETGWRNKRHVQALPDETPTRVRRVHEVPHYSR